MKYWTKVTLADTNRGIRQAYEYQKQIVEENLSQNLDYECWAWSIYRWLECLGLDEAWENRIENVEEFLEIVKERTLELDLETWSDCVNDLSLFRTYRMMKSELKFERYLCAGLSRKQRNILARLRGGLLR